MKKSLFFLSLSSTLFFTACSSTSVVKYFEKEEFYNKAIQYTQKSDISYKNEVQIMLNATYLNSVDASKFNDKFENFIVGIYNINDTQDLGLRNEQYLLLLNGEKPFEIKLLDTKNALTKVPLKNHWAKYYKVSFEKQQYKFFEKRVDNLVLIYANKEKYFEHKKLIENLEEKSEEEQEEIKKISTSSWKASVTFLKEL